MNNQVDTGWEAEFDIEFWYLKNKPLHEIHADGCECRSGYISNLKNFIYKVEQSAIERTKAKVEEMLVGLMGGRSDEHHRGVQDCAKFLKDRLNEL